VTPASPAIAGNTAGSQFHVVQKGETLFGIARSNNIDVNALSAWNNLAAGQVVREGQVLRLAPPTTGAPVTVSPGTVVTPIPATGAIQGQPLPAGTPLPPTGTAPGAAQPAVGAISVLPIEAPLKREPKSQRVPYSDAALITMQQGDTPASVATPGSTTPAAAGRGTAPTAPPATGPSTPAAPATAASGPTTSVTPSAVVDADIKPGNGVERDGIVWTWPTSGKVASKFNDKAPMKGIDIAANAGTPVVAAASGKVIYVGKEPRGYGQMIVVSHAKETVSVYFHTDKVQVKEQQRVLLGAKLAEVSDAAANKMHFEVRRQGRPIDPVSLMPR
jgi:lipoprotein NlpD